MSTQTQDIEEELRALDLKLSQLMRDYDRYFLGARPREPVLLRGDVNKTIARLSNTAIPNTAARFRFSSLCSRFQAFRRQWDETLRKIEEGTYERHRFKARLHEGGPGGRAGGGGSGSDAGTPPPGKDLYTSYVDARLATGENVKGLTREKLERVVAEQSAQLCQKFGADARFEFRVAVEGGKAKLKATRLA